MLRFLGFLFILLIVFSGVVAYSYSQLEVQVKRVEAIRPAFKIDLGSIALGLLSGNPASILGSVIDGVDIDAEVQVRNGSFMPIYLPKMVHVFTLSGQGAGGHLGTDAMWLMPDETMSFMATVHIPTEEIPAVALNALLGGGQIDVEVESTLQIAGITISKSAERAGPVSEPVQDRVTREQNNPLRIGLRPTATGAGPSIVPTSTPLGERNPLRLGPSPTPEIAIPPPIPTSTPKPQSVPGVTLVVSSFQVLDDHDPIGNGEVYLVIGLGNGTGVTWRRHPEYPDHYSVDAGESVRPDLRLEVNVIPSEVGVYIGVWESDANSCYADSVNRLPIPLGYNIDAFAAVVDTLSSCGDDLVGSGAWRWTATEDLGAGEHEVQVKDAKVRFAIEVVR